MIANQDKDQRLGDEQAYRDRAQTLLIKAYKEFEKVNDLKGMYVAKEHEIELLTGEDQATAIHLANHLKEQYLAKCENRKDKHHIKRVFGDKTSLITEVIVNNTSDCMYQD